MRPTSGTLLMVRLPATFSCGAWQGSWFIKSLNWSPEMVYVLSNLLEQQNKATKTLNHQEIGNFESQSFLTRLPNTFSMHFHVWIHHLLTKSRSWNSSTFSTFRVLKPPAACRRSAKDLPPCRVSMQRILLRQAMFSTFLHVFLPSFLLTLGGLLYEILITILPIFVPRVLPNKGANPRRSCLLKPCLSEWTGMNLCSIQIWTSKKHKWQGGSKSEMFFARLVQSRTLPATKRRNTGM